MKHFRRFRLPLVLALIKFASPFLLQDASYGLHRDEYLYLAEGQHLDWGYLEVPPFLSLFARLAHGLGGGMFWVKCWPSLFGALTVLAVCEIVHEMGGKAFAQCVAAFGIITGVYMRVHFLFQPNVLEIFWWTMIALCMVKYINHNNPRYIHGLGILMGLAWMSKYSVLFYAAGIIAGLLLTQNRKVFLQKHIYQATLIALLIALPNLVWQFNHRWPVVTHMKELRETQLQYVAPLDFLKDQLLMHLPVFYIWMGGLTWLLFYRNGKPYRMLGWAFITVIVLLLLSSGKNYYSIGAYPMLFAAGGVWFESITAQRLKGLRYMAGAFSVIVAVYFIPLALPVWRPDKLAAFYTQHGFEKTGVLKWEDLKNHPLPQDFADMLGWKELAAKVSAAYEALPDSVKSKTMIHCRNYGQAGAVTYYGKGLPQVNTDNASFLLWMPNRYQVKNILLITKHFPDSSDVVFQQFEKHRVLDSIATPMAREFGTRLILFENGNQNLNRLIEKSVREQKDEFRR